MNVRDFAKKAERLRKCAIDSLAVSMAFEDTSLRFDAVAEFWDFMRYVKSWTKSFEHCDQQLIQKILEHHAPEQSDIDELKCKYKITDQELALARKFGRPDRPETYAGNDWS